MIQTIERYLHSFTFRLISIMGEYLLTSELRPSVEICLLSTYQPGSYVISMCQNGKLLSFVN